MVVTSSGARTRAARAAALVLDKKKAVESYLIKAEEVTRLQKIIINLAESALV